MSSDGHSISISLDNEDMWAEFAEHTPEMIVTRPGRKLFPKLALNICGLNKHEKYGIRIELTRADKLKYHFVHHRKEWAENGEEAETTARVGTAIYHKDGYVQSGKDWMKTTLEFSDFKITNDAEAEDPTLAFVQSLHKYTPTVQICEQSGNLLRLEPLQIATFVVVTAYQNPEIKLLKVKRNPYAVGQQNKPRHAILLSESSSVRKRPASTPIDGNLKPPPPPAPSYSNPDYCNPSLSNPVHTIPANSIASQSTPTYRSTATVNRAVLRQPAPAPPPPYPFHRAGPATFHDSQQFLPPQTNYYLPQQPPACIMQESPPQSDFSQDTPPPPSYLGAGPSSQAPPSPSQSELSAGSFDRISPPQGMPPQPTLPLPTVSSYTQVWPPVSTPYLGAGPSTQVSPPQATLTQWQPPACMYQMKPGTLSSGQTPPPQAPSSAQHSIPYFPPLSYNSYPQTYAYTQNAPPQSACYYQNTPHNPGYSPAQYPAAYLPYNHTYQQGTHQEPTTSCPNQPYSNQVHPQYVGNDADGVLLAQFVEVRN